MCSVNISRNAGRSIQTSNFKQLLLVGKMRRDFAGRLYGSSPDYTAVAAPSNTAVSAPRTGISAINAEVSALTYAQEAFAGAATLFQDVPIVASVYMQNFPVVRAARGNSKEHQGRACGPS